MSAVGLMVSNSGSTTSDGSERHETCPKESTQLLCAYLAMMTGSVYNSGRKDLRPVSNITRSQEFTREEAGLALRNHGMHLEGLRYPITPIGMHYLLIHFDIPFIDPATYDLPIGGCVRNPLRLTLDEIKARPAVTVPVMMECSGNGRAGLHPRASPAPRPAEGGGRAGGTGAAAG